MGGMIVADGLWTRWRLKPQCGCIHISFYVEYPISYVVVADSNNEIGRQFESSVFPFWLCHPHIAHDSDDDSDNNYNDDHTSAAGYAAATTSTGTSVDFARTLLLSLLQLGPGRGSCIGWWSFVCEV
jgi:hypothetical protein